MINQNDIKKIDKRIFFIQKILLVNQCNKVYFYLLH